MTTESKKLLTFLEPNAPHGLSCWSSFRPGEHARPGTNTLSHDARLAHEMLPVIKQLVDALENSKRAMSSMPQSFGLWVCDIPKIEKAIHSAAPFLQED